MNDLESYGDSKFDKGWLESCKDYLKKRRKEEMKKTDLTKVTVSVSKTIQENDYEPCTILIEQEVYVEEHAEAEVRRDMFEDINNDVNTFFEIRKEEDD